MKNYWDIIANDYDRAYASHWALQEDRALRVLLRKNVKPASRVLDLGVGTGLGHRLLKAENRFPSHYTGIDASEKMLDIAKKRLPESAVLHHANANDYLSQPGDRFNIILGLSGFFSYVSDPIDLLRRVENRLENDGKIILSFFSRYSLRRAPRLFRSSDATHKSRNVQAGEGAQANFYSLGEFVDHLSSAELRPDHVRAIAMLGGVLENMAFWKLDSYICKLCPNLGHTIYLVATRKG